MGNEAVSGRLEDLRLAMGFTKQAEWCRFVGITPQAWNNYESGVNRISLEAAYQVCTRTGVSLDYIYRGIFVGLPYEIVTKLQDISGGQNPAPRRRRG